MSGPTIAQKHIGDVSHKLSALFGEHAESAHLCEQRAIFMRKLMYEMQTLQEPDFDGWGEVSKSWARYWGGVYINQASDDQIVEALAALSHPRGTTSYHTSEVCSFGGSVWDKWLGLHREGGLHPDWKWRWRNWKWRLGHEAPSHLTMPWPYQMESSTSTPSTQLTAREGPTSTPHEEVSTQATPHPPLEVVRSLKCLEDVVEAAHDGRLDCGALELALDPDEPTDILDHLGPMFSKEVEHVRSLATREGLHVLRGAHHLREVHTHGDSAHRAWLGVVGLLDALLVMKREVPSAHDQYTLAGVPACPLMHGDSPSLLCVFRGLMPRPECEGKFGKDYPTFARDTAHGVAPGTFPLSTTKIITLHAVLARLANRATWDAMEVLHTITHQTWEAWSSQEVWCAVAQLLRCLWTLLHCGGSYYVSRGLMLSTYSTQHCQGVHAQGWLEKELRQANLTPDNGFARERVTYTDMIPVSVYHYSNADREVYKGVGTGNHDKGDVNWTQVGAWLRQNGSEMDRGSLCRSLSRCALSQVE